MEDHFAADIMDFERTHQMRSFLCQKYESTGQSTYLAAIRQEQLLHQGDSTVEDFFDQLSVVTLLALSCPLLHVSPAEIRQLHLSFVGPTTF
jgi:hypothetical protein